MSVKENATVLSLMTFHKTRKTVVLRVLGSVIYNIIDNHIFIDNMCLFEDKLSKHDRNFEKQSSMICLGWV